MRILKLMKGDVLFGIVGTGVTFGLSQLNLILGCISGVLTIGILIIKFRREFADRNKPPKD